MKRKIIFGIALMFLFVGILFVGALKNYDFSTKTITLSNTSGTIAEIQLKTPLHFQVGAGYQKVAELDFRTYDDFKKYLSNVELINLTDKSLINRKLDFKYKTTEDMEFIDYKCLSEELENKTIIENCFVNGSYIEKRETWKDINEYIWKNGEIVTIGIFTNVEIGDKVEWIFKDMFGEKIEEWASWTQDLNTGLVGYWSLDETGLATTFRDNTTNYQHNGTLVNKDGLAWKSGASCKIGGCLDLLASNDYAYIGTSIQNGYDDYSDDTTTAFSFNFWIKKPASGTGGDAGFIGKFNPSGVGKPFTLTGDGTTGYYWRFDGNNIGWFGRPPILDWSMVTVNWNTTHTLVYINSTLINATATAYTPSANDSSIILGFYGNIGGQDGNFSIDEIGIWNRSLTQTEITQLWNNGNGIAYSISFESIMVNLSTTNESIFQSSPIYLAGDISKTSGIVITNVSLLINGSINQTNTSGATGVYNFSMGKPADGLYFWDIIAYGNDSTLYSSTNGTFMFNASTPPLQPPVLLELMPNFTLDYGDYGFYLSNLSDYWSSMDYPPSAKNYVNLTFYDRDLGHYVNLSTLITQEGKISQSDGRTSSNVSMFLTSTSTGTYQIPNSLGILAGFNNDSIEVTYFGCNEAGCTQGNETFWILIGGTSVFTQSDSFITKGAKKFSRIFPDKEKLSIIQRLGLFLAVIIAINLLIWFGFSAYFEGMALILLSVLSTLLASIYFIAIGYVPYGLVYLALLIIAGGVYLKIRNA